MNLNEFDKKVKRNKFKSAGQVYFTQDFTNNDNKVVQEKTNKLSLRNVIKKESDKVFKTKFKFLKAHGGLRAGNIHLLLGRAGKGKSTLIQSLIVENSLNGYKTLIYLSETKKTDFKDAIEPALRDKSSSEEEYLKLLDSIICIDKSDLTPDGQHSYKFWVRDLFKITNDNKVDIIYIDNFSTSPFSDSAPEIQSNFVQDLNRTAQIKEIPIFAAIHQSKSIAHEKELHESDIRSNSCFINIPSFIYALNDFCNLDKNLRVLKIMKARFNSECVDDYYELSYKKLKKQGYYTKNTLLPEQSVKRLFVDNSRRKLSGRN